MDVQLSSVVVHGPASSPATAKESSNREATAAGAAVSISSSSSSSYAGIAMDLPSTGQGLRLYEGGQRFNDATGISSSSSSSNSSSRDQNGTLHQTPADAGFGAAVSRSQQQSGAVIVSYSQGSSSASASASSSSTDVSAAAAAAAAASSTPYSKHSLPHQRLFDVLDGCSMVLTTCSLALAAVLCGYTSDQQGLAWAGVLLLVCIVAAPVTVGVLILARNHWLVIALRYCLSVTPLQRDSGLGFHSIQNKVVRAGVLWLIRAMLTLVGFIVAIYLTACYVVTAVLSVPLLDISLFVSVLPRLRKRFISQDLVFLESYKPARALVTAILQALPLAAIALLLLVAAMTGQNAAFTGQSDGQAALNNSDPGSSGGAKKLLEQQAQQWAAGRSALQFAQHRRMSRKLSAPQSQQHRWALAPAPSSAAAPAPAPTPAAAPPATGRAHWGAEAVGKPLADAINQNSPSPAAVATAADDTTPSASSSNGSSSSVSDGSITSAAAAQGGILPTVQVVASQGQGGDVSLTLVVPPPEISGGGGSDGSDGSGSGTGSSASPGYSTLGLFQDKYSFNGSAVAGRARSPSSGSGIITLARPTWAGITASAKQMPLALLYCSVIVGLLDAILVLALLLLGCRRVRMGIWRQLGLMLRLKGGLRVPDFVAEEALGHMVKDAGRRLHLSNVWYWNTTADGTKLPLVPRYLFPPDGGWLVPGQMCHLAALAYNSPACVQGHVQVLELEHASSHDLAVLLHGGIERLPHLRTLNLNWCVLKPPGLPSQLFRSRTLQTLNLHRCEIAEGSAAVLKGLLSRPDCPLRTVSIVKCHLGPESVKAVAAGVAENKCLTKIRFAGNNGGKTAALAFAVAIQQNKTLQHLNLSYNKLCPSGGEALAAALKSLSAAAATSGSSRARLQRLILQRKEIGGGGLKGLLQALRYCTGYNGPLTLRVVALQSRGNQGLPSGGSSSTDPCVLQLAELPVLFVIHEDQELLLSESWLVPVMACVQQQQQSVQLQHSWRMDANCTAPLSLGAAAATVAGNYGSVQQQQLLQPGQQQSVGQVAVAGSLNISDTAVEHSRDQQHKARAAGAHGTLFCNVNNKSSSSSGSSATSSSNGSNATSAASSNNEGNSSNSSFPWLILLSQNDPSDTVAAVLKNVDSLRTIDLGGLHLGSKGARAIAAALPDANNLRQLLLNSTGLAEEGTMAIAAALISQWNANRQSNPYADQRVDRSNTNDDQSTPQLQVLDLSQNTICDAGVLAVAAAVQAGACPQLQLLSLVDNRYPFDWSTVLHLQRLSVVQPGLRIELGAPSSWCTDPNLAAGLPGSNGAESSHKPTLNAVQVAAASAGSSGCSCGSSSDSSNSGYEDAASSVASDNLCGVCLDAPNSLHIRNCGHELCIDCYKQMLKSATASSSRRSSSGGGGNSAGCALCPFCRVPMTGFVYSAWVQGS